MSIDVDVIIDEKIKTEIQEPKRYKVLIINDDQTPMEWVIGILMEIFRHSRETAEKLTLQIHNEGSSVVGIYTYEVAEQKVLESTTASRNQGFPLQFRLEEE